MRRVVGRFVRVLASLLCSLAITFTVRTAQAQTFNCYEGLGVLENNWQDWSWSSNDLKNTSYRHSGPYSIRVTYTGGYQAFSLASGTSFPAGYFSALSFYINGGSARGRSIQVTVIANGANSTAVDLNKYIDGGVVVANAWRKVTIPLSAFGLAPTDSISRFWLQDTTGSPQPAYYLDQIGWVPKPAPAKVDIAVNTTKTLRVVDQKLFGVNTAIWDTGLSSAACKSLVAKGGYKSYRFPAGSLSDDYHWATNTNGTNTWTWASNFEDFVSLVSASSNGQNFITVNYGTSDAAEAAAWVRYSNITKHYNMKYWEVGNENYGRAHDPVIYATQFAQYYAQMKAVDPTIQVGAVATSGEDAYANYADETVYNPRTHVGHNGWTAVMLATIKTLGVTPDFLSYHRYPQYINDCDFTLFLTNASWASDMADLRQQLTDYLGSAGARVQLMCTENNADAGLESKQLCSIVNGLYMADTFGTILQTECNSFLWWDLINNPNTGGVNGPWLYGWRNYGDEGMISPDFKQTYPVYYVEQILNDFAQAGDGVLATTSSYNLISAFAVKRADTSLRVMIVNKNPTAQLTGKIAFTGSPSFRSVTQYSYGIAQDNAAKNGRPQTIAVQKLSGVTKDTAFVYPPYTVTVLAFEIHK